MDGKGVPIIERQALTADHPLVDSPISFCTSLHSRSLLEQNVQKGRRMSREWDANCGRKGDFFFATRLSNPAVSGG
jgi:hypothetical protein